MQRLSRRLRGIDPRRFDAGLGLFVALEGQVELLFMSAPTAQLLFARLLVVVLGVAVAFRRRTPTVTMVVAFLTYLGFSSLDRGISENLVVPFFSLVLVVYTFAYEVRGGRRLAVGLLLALTVAELSLLTDSYDDGPTNLVFSALMLIAAPALLGRIMAQRAELSRALRERAARHERERAQRADAAVDEERARIAGELHDVVAHALGAMVVQAGAARRLSERDPVRAHEAFAAVEATGRDALTEMRALLGVLRRDDEELALDPQPSLAHLSTLVRRSAAAGLPVDVTVEGERSGLPAGVDLVAYRIVQQALGAALEGGSAGRADVRVRYGDGAVEVEVRDDGHDARELPGIRERVALYGGELLSGRPREGGNAVRARLPVVAA